ncbi:MAG: 4Fe-4S binding protein [Anaerolineales bacterium]|jgi:2-oxoglutarate ferredoxin oxidoreductase subunit delta
MKVFARTPLDLGEMPVPHGQVYLIPTRCKGCNLCIELCPRSILQSSPSTNEKGYHLPEIVPGKEADCVHCEFCTMVCPEFAIFTLERVS